MLDEMTCQLGRNEVPGTSVKLAMHGVLSGVDCSEREHPTLRGADGSTYSLRSFSILFSVLFVFMAVHRLHSGRDMRSDFMTCCTSLSQIMEVSSEMVIRRRDSFVTSITLCL